MHVPLFLNKYLFHILKKILLFLLVAFGFSSCETEKEPLDFINYAVERYHNNCNPEIDKCTFISLNYPIAKNQTSEAEKINETINAHLVKIVDYQEELSVRSPEELADFFIKNYEETITEFPDSETAWEASVLAEVSFINDELVSIKFDANIFTGGAHGYNSTSFLNINPKTGEEFSTDDLFTSEFKKIAEEEFRREKDIPTGEPINSTGLFFKDEEFKLPHNVGFTQEKIILYYNAYEIASYAEGAFKLEFPQKDVKEYLKVSL